MNNQTLGILVVIMCMKSFYTSLLLVVLFFSATAQNDAVFVHKGQSIYEFSIQEVDSIVFERSVTSVTGVSLNPASATLAVGETLTLMETVLPAQALNKEVLWISSNNAVATIDNGVVTAVTQGHATIIVVTLEGKYLANCAVNVVIPVTGITLNETSIVLNPNATTTLLPTVLPENATNKNVTWASSNNNVATVSNGVVTAVALGTATITATTVDGGYTATCEVLVEPPIINVTGVTLNETSVVLEPEATTTLVCTVSPTDATNQNVTWASSNNNVATVSNGLVTAVALGTAIITVTTEDGGHTATCAVIVENVIIPVTNVTLNQSSIILNNGSTFSLVATVLPEDATNKNVTWSSSNTNIATVNNGVVTAKGVGTTLITVTTDDGGYTATCSVTVTPMVTLENITTFEQAPTVEAFAAFLNGGTATYDITLMSSQFNAWRQSYSAQFSSFTGFTILLPRSTYQLSVTANFSDGAKWYRSPSDPLPETNGLHAMQGADDNPLCDVVFEIPRSSVSSGTAPPAGYNGSSTGGVLFMNAIQALTGFTIIQDGTTFWFRSKADPNNYFVCVRQTGNPDAVTGVSLNQTSADMAIGETVTLTETVLPANALNKEVIWLSSNPAVATVSDGTVTAVGIGTSIISVITQEGFFTANCFVKVALVTPENIETFEQDPAVESFAAFLNGGTARYDITLMSSKLEAWRQSYETDFPTFIGYVFLLPRSTYQISLAAYYESTSNVWYMGPPSGTVEGIFPMEGGDNNPLSDVTFVIPRNSTGGTVPTGYNSGGAASFRALVQDTAGFTIIQDGTTFWFRSKADPTDWFVCERQ